MSKPVHETNRHFAAFRYWVNLGSGRTKVEVARQFKVSETSIHGWATAFKWQDRLDEIDKDERKALWRGDVEDAVQTKKRQLAVCRAVEGIFMEALNARNIKVTPQDFAKIVQIESLLLGGPTERHAFQLDQKESSEVINIVLGAIDKNIPTKCPHCSQELTIKADLAEEIKESALKLEPTKEDPPIVQ